MKYFVISQPKAGTYLCSNLLTEFNVIPSGIHCNGGRSFKIYKTDDPLLHEYINLNNTDLSKIITHKKNNFNEVLDEIQDNQFAVGHVEHNQMTVKALVNFKKIVVVRNFADYEDAKKRYFETYNAIVRSGTAQLYSNILGWTAEDKTFALTFYDMIDRNIQKLDELQIFLFDKIMYDSKKCIDIAQKKDSLTKSHLRKTSNK